MTPPTGLEHLAGGSGRAPRLRPSLFCLNQAPRAWNRRLEAELRKRNFVQSQADPSLWMLFGEGMRVMCMFC